MEPMKKHFLSLALGLLCGLGAQQTMAASILSVEHLTEAEGDLMSDRTLSSKHITKFTARELPSGREVFVVNWTPGKTPVRAGAQLIFEYQRAGEVKVRSKKVAFPIQVQRARTTQIDVSRDGGRFNGGVARWSVKLVQGGKVLASKASSSWR